MLYSQGKCPTWENAMSKFPSLGETATVPDILKMSPQAGKALLELHEAIMRLPSALTPGQRELVAAYVSGVNTPGQQCELLHTSRSRTSPNMRLVGLPQCTITTNKNSP
jgi:hypothetical protein